MNSKHRVLGWVALAVAVCMVGVCALSLADDRGKTTLTEEEIAAIVDTETDSHLVTSPFIEVGKKVKTSVVGVNNYTMQTSYSYGYGFGFGSGRDSTTNEVLAGTGSGVVISAYGHILTNYHVIEDATRVAVTTAEDETYDAQVVGTDKELDLAVLLVPGLNLPAVPLGDSNQLQVGEYALCVGNPLGEKLARSVTLGIVSALDREVTSYTYDAYGRRVSSSINNLIQVDTAFSSGNSGGGMFNVLGQLMGVPSMKYASNLYSSSTVIEGIGMCIPINVAKSLIREALEKYDGSNVGVTSDASQSTPGTNATEGDLTGKPRLGISVSTLSSSNNAVSQGVLPQGAYIVAVEDGSPAEKAGLQVADIIVEIDGNRTMSSSDVTKYLGTLGEGSEVTIKVYRAPGLEQAERISDIAEGEYLDVKASLTLLE